MRLVLTSQCQEDVYQEPAQLLKTNTLKKILTIRLLVNNKRILQKNTNL